MLGISTFLFIESIRLYEVFALGNTLYLFNTPILLMESRFEKTTVFNIRNPKYFLNKDNCVDPKFGL